MKSVISYLCSLVSPFYKGLFAQFAARDHSSLAFGPLATGLFLCLPFSILLLLSALPFSFEVIVTEASWQTYHLQANSSKLPRLLSDIVCVMEGLSSGEFTAALQSHHLTGDCDHDVIFNIVDDC